MSIYSTTNSGGNYIESDDDLYYDPDVYGNWMDHSNINLNVVSPHVKVNDISSQAQSQIQTQSIGGGYNAPVCPAPKAEKKYGYKICKYEVKEVNPCEEQVKVCKPKKVVCKKPQKKVVCYEEEEECPKPKFIKKKYRGGCRGKCPYYGGYRGGHHGWHHGGHHGGHHGWHGGHHGGYYGGHHGHHGHHGWHHGGHHGRPYCSRC